MLCVRGSYQRYIVVVQVIKIDPFFAVFLVYILHLLTKKSLYIHAKDIYYLSKLCMAEDIHVEQVQR